MTYHDLEQVLPQALDIINYFGARVNASCGLHVHHNLPEAVEQPKVVRNLSHLWWRIHSVVYGLVAPSRKTSQYCRPPRLEDPKRFDKVNTYDQLCRGLHRCDRYEGLNLTNLTNRDRLTVEWRIHQGTTDVVKIMNWVLATQRWVEHAVARSCHYKPEPMSNNREGINALLVTTGLKINSRIYSRIDKEVRHAGKYLLRRWKRFNLPVERKSCSQSKTAVAA